MMEMDAFFFEDKLTNMAAAFRINVPENTKKAYYRELGSLLEWQWEKLCDFFTGDSTNFPRIAEIRQEAVARGYMAPVLRGTHEKRAVFVTVLCICGCSFAVPMSALAQGGPGHVRCPGIALQPDCGRVFQFAELRGKGDLYIDSPKIDRLTIPG